MMSFWTKRIKQTSTVAALAMSLAVSGCMAQEGETTDEVVPTDACTVTLRLATIDLGQRNRANQLISPFSHQVIVQSLETYPLGGQPYYQAVTEEAKRLAQTTYCPLSKVDNVLVDLTFVSANSLAPEEASIMKLPRHGQVSFDADTGVLQAIFVRSQVQTVADIYALATSDDSVPSGSPHAEEFNQHIGSYLRGETEGVPAPIQWLVDGTDLEGKDDPIPAIYDQIRDLTVETDDVYIAVARTFFDNAVPNTDFEGGYGIANLVGPEVADKYKSKP